MRSRHPCAGCSVSVWGKSLNNFPLWWVRCHPINNALRSIFMEITAFEAFIEFSVRDCVLTNTARLQPRSGRMFVDGLDKFFTLHTLC